MLLDNKANPTVNKNNSLNLFNISVSSTVSLPLQYS